MSFSIIISSNITARYLSSSLTAEAVCHSFSGAGGKTPRRWMIPSVDWYFGRSERLSSAP